MPIIGSFIVPLVLKILCTNNRKWTDRRDIIKMKKKLNIVAIQRVEYKNNNKKIK
jgi:hypothetical protein